MADETIFTLVPSTNRGRYALDRPDGPDLTSGAVIAIQLGGQWIEGSVEHTGNLYAAQHGPCAVVSGYYFQATRGGVSGLCVEMKVKLRLPHARSEP